jgi:hypothetical protein
MSLSCRSSRRGCVVSFSAVRTAPERLPGIPLPDRRGSERLCSNASRLRSDYPGEARDLKPSAHSLTAPDERTCVCCCLATKSGQFSRDPVRELPSGAGGSGERSLRRADPRGRSRIGVSHSHSGPGAVSASTALSSRHGSRFSARGQRRAGPAGWLAIPAVLARHISCCGAACSSRAARQPRGPPTRSVCSIRLSYSKMAVTDGRMISLRSNPPAR